MNGPTDIVVDPNLLEQCGSERAGSRKSSNDRTIVQYAVEILAGTTLTGAMRRTDP